MQPRHSTPSHRHWQSRASGRPRGYGFGEAEFAAHDINEFSLGANLFEPSEIPGTDQFRPPFAKQTDEILPNFGYERSEIAALRGGKVI